MIDSRNKRASALNTVPILGMPTADGTIDDSDRQQITWLYSGKRVTVIIIIIIQPPADRTQRVPYQPRWFLVDDDSRVIRVPPESRSVVE